MVCCTAAQLTALPHTLIEGTQQEIVLKPPTYREPCRRPIILLDVVVLLVGQQGHDHLGDIAQVCHVIGQVHPAR